jgi:hypothetical protein
VFTRIRVFVAKALNTEGRMFVGNPGESLKTWQFIASVLFSGLVAAFVGGGASLLVTDMQLKDARSEKRIDQQREDLRDLQDMLAEELGAVDALVRAKHECNEHSAKDWTHCGNDRNYVRAMTKVRVLSVRPLDDRIRDLSHEVHKFCHEAARSRNEKLAASHLNSAIEKYGEVNERIGEILRTQYSQ